jgi:hypothetical protein
LKPWFRATKVQLPKEWEHDNFSEAHNATPGPWQPPPNSSSKEYFPLGSREKAGKYTECKGRLRPDDALDDGVFLLFLFLFYLLFIIFRKIGGWVF